jgi:hypothetical protein
MKYRSKHLPVYTILIGFLLMSFGYNLILYHRLSKANEFIDAMNPWMSVYEYNLLTKEIDRLDSDKSFIKK